MPPSGFSQEAINGLLVFVSDMYKNTLNRYGAQDLSEESVLNESVQYLEGIVKISVPLALDGTVSEEGIKGLQRFVATNYKDLVREIHKGEKTEGEAIKQELDNINDYLKEFTI